MTIEATAAPEVTPASANTPSSAAPAATGNPEGTVASESSAAAPVVVPAEAPAAVETPATPVPNAPEKYDFKSADGKVDPAVLAKFESIAREHDMTQAQAAKLIDTMVPEMAAAQQARQAAMVSQWAEAAKSDKEFGGDKLAENMAVAKKALDTFGTPELTKMLNESGLGNHPEIIRAFFRAGQKISSGNFVPSGQNVSQTSSAGSKLYPNMKQ